MPKFEQIYEVLNLATTEVLGEAGVLKQDLSNVVDVGGEFVDKLGYEQAAKVIADKVGKTYFNNRVYDGLMLNIYKDSWEFGSMLEKISMPLPKTTTNESWDLRDGASYDPNIYIAPQPEVQYWNRRETFSIDYTVPEKQLKSAFTGAEQVANFIALQQTVVNNAMTLSLEQLTRFVTNNMISINLKKAVGAGDVSATTLAGVSTPYAVNLAKLYNETGKSSASLPDVDKTNWQTNADFYRFAIQLILQYQKRLTRYSVLFNAQGKERFTPPDRLNLAFLTNFVKGMNAYLQNDTYHYELNNLPNGVQEVPYWQGCGTDYSLANCSKIDIKNTDGDLVSTDGILAIMYDSYSMGIMCSDPRTTSQYNAKGEFFNYFMKYDVNQINFTDENFVVFYVA